MYKKQLKSLVLLMWLALCTPIAESAPTQGTSSELLKIFQDKDNTQLLVQNDAKAKTDKWFIASFILKVQHPFDPAQGIEIKNCTIMWNYDSCMIKTKSEYEHPPVFRPLGVLDYRQIDYDKDGNLIVWRSLENSVISTKDRNESVEKLIMFRIGPLGDIRDSKNYTQLYRYPVGSAKSTYLFDQFRLATGRGLSKHLIRIRSEISRSSNKGLRSVKAIGKYGESLNGNWDVTFDQEMDFLVREAVFYPDGLAEPLVEIMSYGLIQCPELSIAESGFFRAGSYGAQFRVISLRRTNESDVGLQSLLKEIKERVRTKLTPGASEIIDFSNDTPIRVPSE